MIVVALVFFAGAGVALFWLEERLHHITRSGLAQIWVESFLLPLCRVFALMLLMLLAYPDLFGAGPSGTALPSLGAIVFGVDGRFDHMINVLFLVGLLLPAIPGARKLAGVVMPLQGMAGVAMLFSWLAQTLDVQVRLLPTPAQWLTLATLSAIAMLCAWLLTRAVDDPTRRHDLYDLLLLWLQAPVLLVYGRMLGSQLT
ncbi:MAG: hypothetical protein M3O62_10235 [Pseudomonadota bacterium]|nr:hypothetical protein [Pseudomonadota bacterium]